MRREKARRDMFDNIKEVKEIQVWKPSATYPSYALRYEVRFLYNPKNERDSGIAIEDLIVDGRMSEKDISNAIYNYGAEKYGKDIYFEREVHHGFEYGYNTVRF